MGLSKALVFLVLLLNPVFATANIGAIEERGTERKITLEFTEKTAIFKLFDGSTETDRVEIAQTDRSALEIRKNARSRKISSGYKDVTYFLALNMNTAMFSLFPLTAAVYAAYSLSYLYTLPVDLFSKENGAHRKMEKLLAGENVKASKKTFGFMVEKLFR